MTAVSPGRAELDAVRLLLERIGVSPADLSREWVERPAAPTFADYVPVVSAGVTAGTLRAYGSYWRRVVAVWGERRIDEPSPSEIEALIEDVKRQVVRRRNGRGGQSAGESLVAALRCLYRRAVADGYLTEAENPAAKVAKPRRLPSVRSAIADVRLAEINEVAARSGDDPELDCLLLRLHTETACRRGGALALRPEDLDREQCLIFLREKGGTVRWQPVSPTLMRHLVRHGEERGASRGEQLLRYRDGRVITSRRYDHLWVRVRARLPWADAQQVSTHWLRHTTLTWVDRNFGFSMAHAYAGHTEDSGKVPTTATYVKPTLQELCEVVARLTGETHPLS